MTRALRNGDVATVPVRHRGCGGQLWYKAFQRAVVDDEGYHEVDDVRVVCDSCGAVDLPRSDREPPASPWAAEDGRAVTLAIKEDG